MTKVRSGSDLLIVSLSDQDIQLGISYGIISRAWTYDRMGAQARGDFGKAIFRIAVGKAIQSGLERNLANQGVTFERDTTDYRRTDYWDIRTNAGKSIDIKAFHVFSDYAVPNRPALDPTKLVSSTSGEMWSSFYPMLIPKDQFDRNAKDLYIFAVLSAPNSKRCPQTQSKPRVLIALPHSEDEQINRRLQSIHFANFAERRVRAGQTFQISITRKAVYSAPFNITIGYADQLGAARNAQFSLNKDETQIVTSVTALHYLRWHSSCPRAMGITTNPLLEVTFSEENSNNILTWEVNGTSFEDVWIYPNTLWFIGWITAEDFSEARKQFPTYQPASKQSNQINSRVLSGGLLASGSFCYFYPPTSFGGTKNENYYVLPQDLNTMDTLPAYLV